MMALSSQDQQSLVVEGMPNNLAGQGTQNSSPSTADNAEDVNVLSDDESDDEIEDPMYREVELEDVEYVKKKIRKVDTIPLSLAT